MASLQYVVLLAFAVHLETRAGGGAAPARRPWLAQRVTGVLAAPLRYRAVRAGAALAALGLAAAGLAANQAIYRAAGALYRAEADPGRFMHHLERSIAHFEPLAALPRLVLFENLASHWMALRATRGAEAMRLLAWADAQAAAALAAELAAEPESWILHHALARMYAAAARTEPGLAGAARRHLERSRALAPGRDPLARPAPAPGAGAAQPGRPAPGRSRPGAPPAVSLAFGARRSHPAQGPHPIARAPRAPPAPRR